MYNKKYIYTVFKILFLIFCFIIPFEDYANAVPNILIGLLLVLCPFVIKKEQFLSLFKQKSFLILIIFLSYIIINSFIKNQLIEDFFIVSKLIIPCILIIIALPIRNINIAKQVFVFATVLAVIISLINILLYVFKNEEFKFYAGSFVNELLISERLYIGLCVVISIIFSIQLFMETNKKRIKNISACIVLLLTAFIFLIAARIAIVSTVLVLFIFILTKFKLKNKLLASFGLILFVTFFFTFNSNLTKRFLRLDDKYRKTYYEKIAKHEPRFIIWNCSFKIIKSNHEFFFGNGFKLVKKQLVDCYEEEIELDHKREWFVKRKFNTHNQFLDFFMSSGVVGLILFLLIIYFLFFESLKGFYAISLISSLILFLLVDNILHRQIGNYLLALIFIAVIKQKSIDSYNDY